MRSMQRVAVPQSVILPISTRSVGFMIRCLISKLARLQIQNVDFHALCSALYRVTLLQIDVKLSQAMQNHCSMNANWRLFSNVFIHPDITNAIRELGANFGILVNLVSSIGVMKAFGTQYIPRSVKSTVEKGERSFDPTTVTYSNLREYVTALSSTDTSYAVRKYFYDHSPLPNARWSVQACVSDDDIDESKPVLLNADEIMPANYDLKSRDDIFIIENSIEIIRRKYKEFIYDGGIDYSANGNNSMLISNDVEDIRCSDLSWVRTKPEYGNLLPLSGTIENFWSPEVVSDSEFYLDAIHLLGERVKSTARSEAFDVRSSASAKQRSSLDYCSGLQNLLF